MELNMEKFTRTHGMGWLPDYPDFRDYTTEHEEIKPVAGGRWLPALLYVLIQAFKSTVAARSRP